MSDSSVLNEALQTLVNKDSLHDALKPGNGVDEDLKKVLRSLNFSQVKVVGSDGYRVSLRHKANAMMMFFGMPHVFMTPNLTVRSELAHYIYTCKRDYSQEEIPELPSLSKMNDLEANDPVGQVTKFHIIMKAACEKLFGVQIVQQQMKNGHLLRKENWDCVASMHPGCYGDLAAMLGICETNNAGLLHTHTLCWLHSMRCRSKRVEKMLFADTGVDITPAAFPFPQQPQDEAVSADSAGVAGVGVSDAASVSGCASGAEMIVPLTNDQLDAMVLDPEPEVEQQPEQLQQTPMELDTEPEAEQTQPSPMASAAAAPALTEQEQEQEQVEPMAMLIDPEPSAPREPSPTARPFDVHELYRELKDFQEFQIKAVANIMQEGMTGVYKTVRNRGGPVPKLPFTEEQRLATCTDPANPKQVRIRKDGGVKLDAVLPTRQEILVARQSATCRAVAPKKNFFFRHHKNFHQKKKKIFFLGVGDFGKKNPKKKIQKKPSQTVQ